MTDRLTSIVTRGGDDGSTSLGDGRREHKDAPRICALGEVDELNCVVGLLRAQGGALAHDALLCAIQHDLFDLGSELAVPGYSALTDAAVDRLEAAVEALNADLPALKEFILPGGSHAAAVAHQARSVARRAERTLVALSRFEEVSMSARRYLNRLSDLMFVLSRVLNREAGVPDVLWQPRRDTSGG